MTFDLVHPDARYGPVPLASPDPRGALLLGIQTARPTFPVRPLADPPWLHRLHGLAARAAESGNGHQSMALFQAVGRPPLARVPGVREYRVLAERARYDVLLLVITETPDAVRELAGAPEWGAVREWAAYGTHLTCELKTRVTRQVGSGPPPERPLVLFTFFASHDPVQFLDLWEYLAGWYRVEMGFDHARLMVPLTPDPDGAGYTAVNHAVWDGSLRHFLARQMTRPSFRRYVVGNLTAHHAAAIPTLYRSVSADEGSAVNA